MKTGLPRHFTVIAWPTCDRLRRSTSIEDSASVSAAGFILSMNGQAVAATPTARHGAGRDHEEIAPGRIAVPAGRNG